MNDAHLMTTDDVVTTIPCVWQIKVAGRTIGKVTAILVSEVEYIGSALVNPTAFTHYSPFKTLEAARDWVVAEHYKRTSQEEK